MENQTFWAFLAITFIVGLTLGIAIYGSSITGRAFFGLFPDDTDDAAQFGLGNQTNCIDSDGGINLPVKGTCNDDSGYKTDVCLNTTYLKEYFCVNATSCNWHVYNCARFNYTSCYNGACTRNQTTAAGTSGTAGGATPATVQEQEQAALGCTYQEVLNMLNQCTITIARNNSNASCNNVCQQQNKTCVQAYSFDEISKGTLPYQCNWIAETATNTMVCNCCLPSGEGVQVQGTPRSGKCESRVFFMPCTQSSCRNYCGGKCYAPGVQCSIGASCDEDVCFCECTGGGAGSG